MSSHGSSPDQAGIREPSSAEPVPASPPLPAAWQPITFRGVAAFSRARFGRLLLLQTVVSLVLAATVTWFLHHAWLPRILEAIRALPPNGVIENQILTTPRATHEPLAADNFIALSINLGQAASLGSASDLRIEFHRTSLSLCSLFGCLRLDYPPGYVIQFNQPELESWWGAWRLSIFAGVIAATIVTSFASWLLLAIVYAVPVWLAGFFKDRQLTLFGSWKLASAALLAPALALALSIALYGLHAVDLLRLLLLWIAHVPLGWVYLYCSLRCVPKVVEAGPPRTNPFGGPSKKPPVKDRGANPFTTS